MVEWLAQQPEFKEVPLTANQMRLFEARAIHERRLEEIEHYLHNTQFPAEAPIIKVDSQLHNQVGLDPETLEFPWQPEPFGSENKHILWLGQGEQSGLRGVLWAQTQTLVNLRFDLVSGPSISQAGGTVYLAGLVGGNIMTAKGTFTEATTLDFQVPLRPGPNPFTFSTRDRPNIFIHDRGDTRPLIVGIRGLIIEPAP
jgi:hypothetical protein